MIAATIAGCAFLAWAVLAVAVFVIVLKDAWRRNR